MGYTCERCHKFRLGEICKYHITLGYTICLSCVGYFMVGYSQFEQQLKKLLQ